MRSMSLEKSRQREAELAQEIERLQMEIKTLQKNSEEAANVNQQLSKEVRKKFFWHFFDDQALDLNKESSILVSIGPEITARWGQMEFCIFCEKSRQNEKTQFGAKIQIVNKQLKIS